MTRTGVYTCPDCGATTEGNGEPMMRINHAAVCVHVGGTDGIQGTLVRCPKCNRTVDIGPTSVDQCGDDSCGIIFNIGVALRSTAHPINVDVSKIGEEALESLEITLPPGMGKIELIARGICQRLGQDPDMDVAYWPPQKVPSAGMELYRVPSGVQVFKLWQSYAPLAETALREAKDCT